MTEVTPFSHSKWFGDPVPCNLADTPRPGTKTDESTTGDLRRSTSNASMKASASLSGVVPGPPPRSDIDYVVGSMLHSGEWIQVIDEVTHRPYYYSIADGATTWDLAALVRSVMRADVSNSPVRPSSASAEKSPRPLILQVKEAPVTPPKSRFAGNTDHSSYSSPHTPPGRSVSADAVTAELRSPQRREKPSTGAANPFENYDEKQRSSSTKSMDAATNRLGSPEPRAESTSSRLRSNSSRVGSEPRRARGTSMADLEKKFETLATLRDEHHQEDPGRRRRTSLTSAGTISPQPALSSPETLVLTPVTNTEPASTLDLSNTATTTVESPVPRPQSQGNSTPGSVSNHQDEDTPMLLHNVVRTREPSESPQSAHDETPSSSRSVNAGRDKIQAPPEIPLLWTQNKDGESPMMRGQQHDSPLGPPMRSAPAMDKRPTSPLARVNRAPSPGGFGIPPSPKVREAQRRAQERAQTRTPKKTLDTSYDRMNSPKPQFTRAPSNGRTSSPFASQQRSWNEELARRELDLRKKRESIRAEREAREQRHLRQVALHTSLQRNANAKIGPGRSPTRADRPDNSPNRTRREDTRLALTGTTGRRGLSEDPLESSI